MLNYLYSNPISSFFIIVGIFLMVASRNKDLGWGFIFITWLVHVL